MGSISHKVYKAQQEHMPAKVADDQKDQQTAQRSELKNLKISSSFFGMGDPFLDKLLGRPE